MIRIEDLRKQFGEKTAVAGVDLEIPEGELFVLLGPNGAGKTTTIRILAGLLRPTSGTASIGGHDTVVDGAAARALLAYVPDEPYLYERLTAREFLRFVGELYGMERDRADSRIEELAETFGFAGYMDELCGSYSHGMRQRVVIGAALLHDPSAIVIDEPMVGLDPRSARVVRATLRNLAASGVAILMSTHTLPVAEELADRIGVIDRGRLVALGTFAELQERHGGRPGLEDLFLSLTDDEPAATANPSGKEPDHA